MHTDVEGHTGRAYWKGILMSKQVPAFLKVQLRGLEVLLAWGNALSLSESCREGALPKQALLIINYLQSRLHFLNCRNYFKVITEIVNLTC